MFLIDPSVKPGGQSTTVAFYIPQMILQKEFHVIYALAHVCGQDRTLLASLLLKIFRHEKAEAPLLRTLNDREINMEGNRRQRRRVEAVPSA